MNQETEVLFDPKHEKLSQNIKPLIDGEYSNKFQELYSKINALPFNLYEQHRTLHNIKYVLGTNQPSIRIDKKLKEQIRKGLDNNVMFIKGISEDVKE